MCTSNDLLVTECSSRPLLFRSSGSVGKTGFLSISDNNSLLRRRLASRGGKHRALPNGEANRRTLFLNRAAPRGPGGAARAGKVLLRSWAINSLIRRRPALGETPRIATSRSKQALNANTSVFRNFPFGAVYAVAVRHVKFKTLGRLVR